MADKESNIAITPDFNNSLLTFGPTFSTLLKLKLFPISNTNFFTFISTSSRISKAGSAVQDMKSASASLMFNLVKVSN